jgi:hypothetical protein
LGDSLTGNGHGVIGYGNTGVIGIPLPGGTGVVAATALDGTGNGLSVLGPALFTLSGLASIAAGAKSVKVTGVSLRTASLVLATVQNSAGVHVLYAEPDVSGSSIAIHLNTTVPKGKSANVAWFVVN